MAMNDYQCQNVINNHIHSMPIADTYRGSWQERHIATTRIPRFPAETGIWSMINAFAQLADGYAAQTGGERLLGQDGYFADHAVDLVKAMRAYLNFDVGRFDCGTLDRLICDLAKAAGVELED